MNQDSVSEVGVLTFDVDVNHIDILINSFNGINGYPCFVLAVNLVAHEYILGSEELVFSRTLNHNRMLESDFQKIVDQEVITELSFLDARNC